MKKKLPGKWIVFAALIVAGLVFRFAWMGYLTMALLCFGVAGLILVYDVLDRLANKSKAVRVLRSILSVGLALGILATAGTWSLILSERKGRSTEGISYVVVLGAGVNGSKPSQSMHERLTAAKEFLDANPEVICVVSGGQGAGEDITEAQCMYDTLVSWNISEDRIWQEDQATNTLENLSYSLDLIEAKTGTRPEKIGLISSEYHLFRACEFARDAGVNPAGIPATTRNPVLRLNYYLREVVAVWYYLILGG